jgi:hypothetical protein
MKTRFAAILLIFALGGMPCFSADRFLSTASSPRLHIKSVKKPTKPNQPLELSVEMTADGTTSVALSQEQIAVSIHAENEPYLFQGKPTFPKDTPNIFTVAPTKPATLSFTVSINEYGRHEHWSKLPKGNYTLRVYVNSGKSAEFDYQWLGQTYSDTYKLKID